MQSSHQIIQKCITATKANVERATSIFSHLSEKQLNWKPNPDSWSVGECISHLINSNSLYLSKIENILGEVKSTESKDFSYKQSLVGKMIVKGVDPKNVRKSKTFKVFFPDSSNIKKSIIEDYAVSSDKFIRLADNLRHLDLKKIKLSSPVNKLLRMNLGDPLIIIPLHDERHLNQAERVMNHKDFPGE
ncbi:MAG: DinB family protein [bacterium]|nr:DinB family protein [bacterium]